MGKGFKYSVGCEATSAFGVEVQTKVREDFTITEKAHTWAFSWLKAPTSTFTFKTLNRQALIHGE